MTDSILIDKSILFSIILARKDKNKILNVQNPALFTFFKQI